MKIDRLSSLRKMTKGVVLPLIICYFNRLCYNNLRLSLYINKGVDRMENYKTSGVCSSDIYFEVENGVISSVEFVRGCPGNSMGVALLVKGLTPEEAISRLKGIDCRGRGTSCPDQLAKALEAYLNKE